MRHYALCFATWLLHTFSTVLLIKAGDTDHVFDFFTNIEPTLVGGRYCVSLILITQAEITDELQIHVRQCTVKH